MRPTTTTPTRVILPLILILTLLSSFSTTTTDARAIPQKRSPDSNDDNGARDTLIVYPSSGQNPDHILYPPGKDPGSLHTDNKRRKRSDTQLRAEAKAEAEEGTGARIEKRNLFSQLLNTDRLHRRPSMHHVFNLNMDDETNSDTNGRGSGRAEEYSYWTAEEEEEEGIDEEDDLARHGGIFEDDDDDEGFWDVDIVSQLIGGASTPTVIEPFIHHPAHGSSLFDTDISSSSNNGNDRVGDHDEKSSNARDSNGHDDEEDLDRIRASQPWYHHQYPSSSSPKHHNDKNNDDADIFKSQIWIVDEWDEDFGGVEETIDDFIDWIDDLDHVRSRPAGGDHSGNNFPLRRLFS